MDKRIAMVSACAHRLYLYRPELFRALWDEGYKVTVFGPEPQAQGDEWLNKESIPYVSLPVSRRGLDPLAELRAQALLTEKIKETGAGLVFSYGIRFAPLANNAAKKAGVPCINVINGAGSLFIAEGIGGDAKRLLVLPYIRLSLRGAKRVVFQNADDEALFLKRRLVKQAQVLRVAGSGVNTERFPVLPLPEAPVFGYLSRMNPEKGVGELLTAFAEMQKTYPAARLLLAGEPDGIEKTDAQKQLERLCESGAAQYRGEITDVVSFLGECRCFVFPSYREGTPRAVLEAMSCGRPVITTSAPGCKETVTDGYNGLLVPPRDTDALRDAMLRFCAQDGGKTAEMGRNARTVAETRFNVHAVNRTLISEINQHYGKRG